MDSDNRRRPPGSGPPERDEATREQQASDGDARTNLADLWSLIERGRKLSARSQELMARLSSLFRDRE